MDSQRFWHLFFMFIWIFVFFFHPVCLQMDSPILSLNSSVFMILRGEDLSIECVLKKKTNQSEDTVTCSDPFHKHVRSRIITRTAGQAETYYLTLVLEKLAISGEYYCKYHSAKVYWFLRVRDDGFNMLAMWDYKECIIVAVFTGVLLLFSVVGSVYVFRGHWITKCGEPGRKRKQNKDERKDKEMKDDNVNAIIDPSTSFYASLEPRTRSIYDELHYSDDNKKPEQQRAKPKKKEPHQTKQQTTQQDEGQFDSVYENY